MGVRTGEVYILAFEILILSSESLKFFFKKGKFKATICLIVAIHPSERSVLSSIINFLAACCVLLFNVVQVFHSGLQSVSHAAFLNVIFYLLSVSLLSQNGRCRGSDLCRPVLWRSLLCRGEDELCLIMVVIFRRLKQHGTFGFFLSIVLEEVGASGALPIKSLLLLVWSLASLLARILL